MKNPPLCPSSRWRKEHLSENPATIATAPQKKVSKVTILYTLGTKKNTVIPKIYVVKCSEHPVPLTRHKKEEYNTTKKIVWEKTFDSLCVISLFYRLLVNTIPNVECKLSVLIRLIQCLVQSIDFICLINPILNTNRCDTSVSVCWQNTHYANIEKFVLCSRSLVRAFSLAN